MSTPTTTSVTTDPKDFPHPSRPPRTPEITPPPEDHIDDDPQQPKNFSKFLRFLTCELTTQTPQPQNPQPQDNPQEEEIPDAYAFAAKRREKVYTFVTIPRELEKLMGYGFFQCADAFLYVFTFLPLRCCLAAFEYLKGFSPSSPPVSLRPSDKCDLLKTSILVVCCWLFMYIDTNVLYHVIKSQSVIKLYIFFNMLEVGDRLFGCFSQDTLDALFITATEHDIPGVAQQFTPSSPDPSNKSRTRAIKKLSTTTHAIICGVSILGHALVILLQSTTLSVAINANNRALLTVMMSNNFVELKGAVFKKFDKMNLFQVACSDIRERFHLFILLLIVCLQTLREYSWEESRFWVLLPDCLMVLLAEIGVDWIKHAFITRFNELPLQVYSNYTRSLAYDMAESVKRKQSHQTSTFNDYSDVVGRRLGFVPLPLAIVLIRVVSPMWRVNGTVIGVTMLSFLGYVGLASFRVLNLVVLVGKAVRIIDEHSNDNTVASGDGVVQNSILKRTRTISGSDGDLLLSLKRSSQKLKFQDDCLKDEGMLQRNYLLANSNVSLYSVGFNEEMMKVEKEIEAKPPVVFERKHSLGSNLYDGVLLCANNDLNEHSEQSRDHGNNNGQSEQPRHHSNDGQSEQSRDYSNDEQTEQSRDHSNDEQINQPRHHSNDEQINQPRHHSNDDQPRVHSNDEQINQPRHHSNDDHINEPRVHSNDDQINEPRDHSNDEQSDQCDRVVVKQEVLLDDSVKEESSDNDQVFTTSQPGSRPSSGRKKLINWFK